MLTPEGRTAALWLLFALTVVLIALRLEATAATHRAAEAQRLTDEQRVAHDGCEYTTVEFLEPMNVGIRHGVTMPYPGGWHWRVECPDGSTFHVRVPRP